MLDFLLCARDLELIHSITDNGAGGLSSSVGELGEETGVRVDLDKCPLKYPGLKPWEILLSEAQERMSVVVPKDKINEFLTLAKEARSGSNCDWRIQQFASFSIYLQFSINR